MYGPGTVAVKHVKSTGQPVGITGASEPTDGHWTVARVGSNMSEHDTKRQAVKSAKNWARDSNAHVEVVVENKNGGVTERVEYEGADDDLSFTGGFPDR